jgi:hypothetical protein
MLLVETPVQQGITYTPQDKESAEMFESLNTSICMQLQHIEKRPEGDRAKSRVT